MRVQAGGRPEGEGEQSSSRLPVGHGANVGLVTGLDLMTLKS